LHPANFPLHPTKKPSFFTRSGGGMKKIVHFFFKKQLHYSKKALPLPPTSADERQIHRKRTERKEQ
jgi:hypothetical protein